MAAIKDRPIRWHLDFELRRLLDAIDERSVGVGRLVVNQLVHVESGVLRVPYVFV